MEIKSIVMRSAAVKYMPAVENKKLNHTIRIYKIKIKNPIKIKIWFLFPQFRRLIELRLENSTGEIESRLISFFLHLRF